MLGSQFHFGMIRTINSPVHMDIENNSLRWDLYPVYIEILISPHAEKIQQMT